MRWLWFLLLLLPGLAQAAPQVVSSEKASDVAVTIYRDPYRSSGMMNAAWPGGYALITETRTITLPAGEVLIRFENVAEGLLPETAIITGLPRSVREKNRDARLISPAGLVDAYLKRRVLLRRTDPATGKVVEENAVIQSGPSGGVLLQTASGVEALRCSGLPERMTYGGVPDTLSAKPTLSILTRSDRPVTAIVQLTYMAQGFDWSANYVGNMAADGSKMGLFAWLTVANGGQQSFPQARLQVIAGKPNKQPNNPPPPPPSAWLDLQCWPMDVTSTHPQQQHVPLPMPPVYDMSQFNDVGRNAPGSFESKKDRKARLKRERYESEYESVGEIIVTGTASGGGSYRPRRMKVAAADMAVPQMVMAAPPPPPPPPAPPPPASENVAIAEGAKAGVEDLGDLKLYRVPMRVNVSAQSQKQVAMISQPSARFERIYSFNVGYGPVGPAPALFGLRARNVKEQGLGLALPAGSLALFATTAERHLLVGEYPVADLAAGEEIELGFGQSSDVQWTHSILSHDNDRQVWKVEISNARNVPVEVEIIIPRELENKPPGLKRGRGGWVVPVTVPANWTTSMEYGVKFR